MSSGLICSCTAEGHPHSRLGGCPRYSADQEYGGTCGSCRLGYHRACDKPRATFGICGVCGWHMSNHPGPEPLRGA